MSVFFFLNVQVTFKNLNMSLIRLIIEIGTIIWLFKIAPKN